MRRKLMMTVLLACSLILMPALAGAGDMTATRAEFEEFCNTFKGRWIGDVTWAIDFPGYGRKGENVTAYWKGEMIADGSAMLATFYGGNGTGIAIFYYDPGTKQIRSVDVSSGGSTAASVLYKVKGKWLWAITTNLADGGVMAQKHTLTLSDNGRTAIWTGPTTLDGEKIEPSKDVWRRVSK